MKDQGCTHYWVIDDCDVGTCKKCGKVRDFGKLQRRQLVALSHKMAERATQQVGKPRGRKRKGRR